MGEFTGITWADHTSNWWWGCDEVTNACDNCYAREWAWKQDAKPAEYVN